MQIPRKYIENYSNSLNVVSEQARRKLADALSQIDYTQDVATIRNAVIAVMQPACGASTQVAAKLAADFYDGLRVRFGVVDDFEAEPQSLRIPDATDGAVRAFVQDFVEEKPLDGFIGKCVDRIDYETRRAANECVAYNAKNDPEKPRWARVPTGAETCEWCIMLASRGFVYHSEETASHTHAHCNCRVVPSWDKDNPAVQGYDPEKYYDMWKHPEKYENAQPGVSTVQIVGVSKGKPMNFDDADGMKANPGYESDFARAMNCQTCVVANEARRRGYDVQAQPYSKQNEAMFALAERPTRAYINPETGKEPEMIRVEESPTKARFNKLCEETVKDGERYHLRIETKAGGGHVVCMDRDENGVLRVYDPQDGSIYKASEYLKRARYSSKSYGITVPEDNYIFRVDNAEFNTELINGALEPAQ
jgi:hypothetical protein